VNTNSNSSDVDRQIEGANANRSNGLRLVRDKIADNRNERIDAATRVILEHYNRTASNRLPAEDFRAFKAALTDAAQLNSVLDTIDAVAVDSRTRAAVISYEPRVYSPAFPEHSFLLDLATISDPTHPDHRAAAERLARHGHECAVEAQKASAEGRRVRRAWREGCRTENAAISERNSVDEEIRALSTGSTSAGAFVSPYYLVSEWAAYRGAYRAFVDQCRGIPLPPYGMKISLPSFTSTASAASQTELSGVSETDPSGAYLSTSIVTLTGQITASQQLYDRGGQDGLAFDKIAGLQIKEQLDAAIDTYVLTQALAGAGTVSDSAGFSITNLFADLATAREQSQDAAGVRLKATHCFMTTDLAGHVQSQVDTANRPIVTPEFTAEPYASLLAKGDPKGLGWSGIILPGALALFEDNSIPASGANTQIVVARPQEILVFEGDPIPFAYPETLAGSLAVVIGLRVYIGCIVRWAKSVQSISGNAYASSLS
jgi:HK97 family phage major capsid protein